MRLSTMLLELVVVADATLAGTHDLTPQGLTYMRDQLDIAVALATALESLAQVPPPETADAQPAGENVIPFPAALHPFHGFR